MDLGSNRYLQENFVSIGDLVPLPSPPIPTRFFSDGKNAQGYWVITTCVCHKKTVNKVYDSSTGCESLRPSNKMHANSNKTYPIEQARHYF